MSYDEMSPERLEAEEGLRREELTRGNRARQIFDDELVQDALETIRENIWKSFATTPANDLEGLRHLRLKLEILAEFRDLFLRVMKTGDFAEEQLSYIGKMLERMKGRRAA